MTILIIIIAYIANVFLNRWLNKVLYKMDKGYSPNPFIWCLSLAATLAYIDIILNKSKYKGWFKGENWDKE